MFTARVASVSVHLPRLRTAAFLLLLGLGTGTLLLFLLLLLGTRTGRAEDLRKLRTSAVIS